jgi:peroxiredoxin
MAKIQEGTAAPGFTLTDTEGQSVALSDYKGQKYVVLVLNRGFA